MKLTLENFSKSFDDVKVIENLSLTVADGEMLALLGPSGCGKSTTLFAISGIHRANGGRILFGDRDVTDLPSQKRNVGVVFQNYALYPHMTVFQNIAFPLEVNGRDRGTITKEVHDIAALTHIEELLERRPAQLSGGQQQRVALARAIVRRPHVLLLDEPLANLDAKLRLEMRSEIRRIQTETGITAILVTHDQVEAMSMCDRVAIMNTGKILQLATPTDMYRQPANQFVAGFLGNPPITFVSGTIDPAGDVRMGHGATLSMSGRLRDLAPGTSVTLGIRPEHVGPQGSAPIAGKLTFIEPQGREMLLDIELASGLVLRSIQPYREDVRVGDRIEWGVDADQILTFDIHGERL